MKKVLGQRGPERLLFCPRSLRPSVNELILESRPLDYPPCSFHCEHGCTVPGRREERTYQWQSPLDPYGHREIRSECKFKLVSETISLNADQSRRDASFKCCQRSFDAI